MGALQARAGQLGYGFAGLIAPASYWITARSARRILGVNHTRLNQLAVRGFIPFEMHVDGTRLYRRMQLQVVANARDVRWASYQARGSASSAQVVEQLNPSTPL